AERLHAEAVDRDGGECDERRHPMRGRDYPPHRVLLALTIAGAVLIAGCTAGISGTPEPLPSSSSGGTPVGTGTARPTPTGTGGAGSTSAPTSPSPQNAGTGTDSDTNDLAAQVPTRDSLTA